METALAIDPLSINLSRMNTLRGAGGVVFGDALYRPRGSCGPRTQADFQLVAIYRGEARVRVGSGMLHIPPNHVALMQPGIREHFHFSVSQPTHHTWCAVAPELGPMEFAQTVGRLPQVIPLSARMHGLLEIGLGLPHSDDPSFGQTLHAFGIAALRLFQFEAEASHGKPAFPEPVIAAKAFIEHKLGDSIGLDDIAGHAGVSSQHLIRLFRRYLGSTPSRYLWETRTRRGVELLRETGLGISEISERVGFQSPFHFSRLVRKQYGTSPREVRRAAWREPLEG
jgi:AraC family transcriptional regulator of arabinose operon